MSEIDIRETSKQSIGRIRFADSETEGGDGFSQADVMRFDEDAENVEIMESSNGDFVRINSKEHALNLIKALEKAIELEWLK